MSDWLVTESLTPHTAGPLAPLYAAAAVGVLALPFCESCGQPLELEQTRCDGCGGATVDWRPVEPAGTIHSVTTVHRREPGLIRATEPYHVVDVELTSGHRLVMTTAGPTAARPAISDPAAVVFRDVGGVAVPSLAVPQEVPR